MHLATLRLQNFRNYPALELPLQPGVHLILGRNAQGKTNLLESIAYLALGRSFRVASDRDLIRWGAPEMRVAAGVDGRLGRFTLELEYSWRPGEGATKQARLNGLKVERLSQLLGNLLVVVFTPGDLELVKGPPACRRRMLDTELVQLNAGYRSAFARYQRALAQRNSVLRAWQASGSAAEPPPLAAWDQELAETGARLVVGRLKAVARLRKLAAEAHAALAGGSERLELGYECSLGGKRNCLANDEVYLFGGSPESPAPDVTSLTEVFLSELHQRRPEERRRGTTLVGPHRDDLALWLDRRDARIYASQGQQRTVSLALKLAEVRYFQQVAGEFPVLLLDDVLSELDEGRQTALAQALGPVTQVFLTATALSPGLRDVWPGSFEYEVQDGKVTRRG